MNAIINTIMTTRDIASNTPSITEGVLILTDVVGDKETERKT